MTQMTKKQTLLIWILTVVITLVSVVYQRLTGPTYPVHGSVEIDGETINYKLLTSHYSSSDAVIAIKTADQSLNGEISRRRLKSNDNWQTDSLTHTGNGLQAIIPKQPEAGKIAYRVILFDGDGQRYELSEKPIVLRFKGDVPAVILLPHILLMFIAMLLGTRAGLEALYKRERAYIFVLWTTPLFFLGGIILGPIVQKFAFGSFWTGWPLGSDLTDNKTAVALLGWIMALWRGRNMKSGGKWIIIAAVLQLAVYLIPHSMFGSEFDYTQSSPQSLPD